MPDVCPPHRMGFFDVVEVAVGADKVAAMEAEEFVERVLERGDKFMTTSCCPAYYMTVGRPCTPPSAICLPE